MLIIKQDFMQRGFHLPLRIKINQQRYKFMLELMYWRKPYHVPEGTELSVCYEGPGGKGRYSTIDDRSAFEVNGNSITVEISPEMVTHTGEGALCIRLNFADGSQIGLWNIQYVIEPMFARIDI